MITFTEQDTVDGFEIFMESFIFKGDYNFYALLNIFLKFLEKDIREGYAPDEQEKVRQLTRKHIFKHFHNIDFSITYNKEEILSIVFPKNS